MLLNNRINRKELKERMMHDAEPRTVISFYKYYHLPNPHLFRDHLYIMWQQLGVLGRTYIAKEGINAQISVPTKNLDHFRTKLEEIEFLIGNRLNFAIENKNNSFFKLDIRVRDKIVADGLDDAAFDVTQCGVHLTAEKFNEITAQPDTILVDMRNHYESEVGHFKDAIIPDVETFREQLPMVADMLEAHKDKNLVMYCTGGIRCEKASAYMKFKGFKNVYQLEGGIIKYAHDIEEKGLENKFIGKNFVFDERLGERVSTEVIAKCHQCGSPCDDHVNCANDACHLLFIQCKSCAEKKAGCCSTKCQDFVKLPEETQKELRKTEKFNGTLFGKSRYKAYRNKIGELLE